MQWRELPTASTITIEPPDDLPSGWRLMNPSIATDGQRMRMSVRAVNYRISHDRYVMADEDHVIRSRTGIVDVSPEGGVSNWRWLDDSSALAESPEYPVHGVEDIRLFARQDRWWVMGAVRDHSPSGAIRQVLAGLVDEPAACRLERAWRIPSPLTADDSACVYEKNWVPVPHERHGLEVVWSTEPLVRLRVDSLTRQSTASLGRPSSLMSHEWRGGSPVFLTPHGPAYVTHRVGPGLLAADRPSRTYLHRFETYCGDHVHSGPAFVVEELALEFVAGACVVGDRLFLSFGRDDAQARLAICDWTEASALIPRACPANS